jgi:hypothetical protein
MRSLDDGEAGLEADGTIDGLLGTSRSAAGMDGGLETISPLLVITQKEDRSREHPPLHRRARERWAAAEKKALAGLGSALTTVVSRFVHKFHRGASTGRGGRGGGMALDRPSDGVGRGLDWTGCSQTLR